ncbi:hypothetical protein [Streptomyces sp. NPDC056661]|uniref:hypothetical protein n=1 Tax=Streptomyces sp. NPDC056661 TaxID=3345898 RepID=UPI00368E58D6
MSRLIWDSSQDLLIKSVMWNHSSPTCVSWSSLVAAWIPHELGEAVDGRQSPAAQESVGSGQRGDRLRGGVEHFGRHRIAQALAGPG